MAEDLGANGGYEAARHHALPEEDDTEGGRSVRYGDGGGSPPSIGAWNISLREVFYVLALVVGWSLGWSDLKSTLTGQSAGILAIQQRLDAHERQSGTTDEQNDRALAVAEGRLAAHENSPGHMASLERIESLRLRLDHLEQRVQAIEQYEAQEHNGKKR